MNKLNKLNKLFSKIGIIFVLAILLAFVMIYAYKSITNPKLSTVVNKSEFSLNTKKINIYDTIIKQVKEQNNLIVLEVEAEQAIEVNKAFWNLDVFKKSKSINFFGKGQFVLNLSSIKKEDIAVDDDSNKIILNIDTPTLENVFIDEEKTNFKQTQKGIFAFGDYKITFEEYNNLIADAKEKIKSKINSEIMIEKAKESAKDNLTKLLENILNNYDINVKFKSESV